MTNPAEDVLREIEQKAVRAAQSRDSLLRFAETMAAYYNRLVELGMPEQYAATLTMNMQVLLASAGVQAAKQQQAGG